MSAEECAYCGQSLETWYDPWFPKSCWMTECRNQEVDEKKGEEE